MCDAVDRGDGARAAPRWLVARRRWAARTALGMSCLSLLLTACGRSEGGPRSADEAAAVAARPDAGTPAAEGEPAAGAKATQCNALIGVINDGVVRLESAAHGMADSSGISELNRMADSMEETARAASKVPLTDPELVRLGRQYVTMARDVVRAARRMGMAAQAKDATAIAAAQHDMETAVQLEDPLVDELNRFCQAP
jgi:hypothetical protein